MTTQAVFGTNEMILMMGRHILWVGAVMMRHRRNSIQLSRLSFTFQKTTCRALLVAYTLYIYIIYVRYTHVVRIS